MYHQNLSDEAIISGFRKGDSRIIRKYFYGYCRAGYYLFDRRYQLSEKENLDFMSLAHQYAIYLMEHDWKPLEDHSPNVTLKTWLINGFRYVVLDALKWHRKEYGSITFKDYLRSFDSTSDLRLHFNRMLADVCEHMPMGREGRLIIHLLFIKGYKEKEIAERMKLTPSAISQKVKKLKEDILIPYFRKNFDMELEMPEIMAVEASYEDSGIRYSSLLERSSDSSDYSIILPGSIEPMQKKRTTPEFITELQPGEIFVFGSNLRGMHGGGAARVAFQKFGAIWGEGVGLHGQSYAIPTMQGGVETIRPYVDEFIRFAQEHPELTFLVTRIGCGIAGFTDDDIAPLFEEAQDIENIVLPEEW